MKLNGHDPIKQSGPNKQAELFQKVTDVCNGFPIEDVLVIAANLLINGVRQSAATWQQAEQQIDERFGRAKNVLHECYDGVGKRRHVFPFNQIIEMPFVDFSKNKDRWK